MKIYWKFRHLQIAESICFPVLIIGVLFKILHLTGADQLLMFGALTLAFVYMAAGLIGSMELEKYYRQKGELKAGDFVRSKLLLSSGLSLSVFIVGKLFAILHLPGADQMELVGSISALAAFIANYIVFGNGYPVVFRILNIRLGVVAFLAGLSIIFFLYGMTG